MIWLTDSVYLSMIDIHRNLKHDIKVSHYTIIKDQ